jgi:hypothetical protein
MKHGVVEGEPGIFPAPVARVLRTIGGLFSRSKGHPDPAAAPASGAPAGEDTPLSDLDPEPPSDRTTPES